MRAHVPRLFGALCSMSSLPNFNYTHFAQSQPSFRRRAPVTHIPFQLLARARTRTRTRTYGSHYDNRRPPQRRRRRKMILRARCKQHTHTRRKSSRHLYSSSVSQEHQRVYPATVETKHTHTDKFAYKYRCAHKRGINNMTVEIYVVLGTARRYDHTQSSQTRCAARNAY